MNVIMWSWLGYTSVGVGCEEGTWVLGGPVTIPRTAMPALTLPEGPVHSALHLRAQSSCWGSGPGLLGADN